MSARETLKAEAAKRILLTDGAFGTEIQNLRLTEADYRGALDLARDQKGNNDILALTRPDAVDSITRAYLAAGSDIVFTPRGTQELRGVPGDWELFAIT